MILGVVVARVYGRADRFLLALYGIAKTMQMKDSPNLVAHTVSNT